MINHMIFIYQIVPWPQKSQHNYVYILENALYASLDGPSNRTPCAVSNGVFR